MGRRRRPNELRLMAALGVVAVSAMVFTDGGLFGDVPDKPTGALATAQLPLIELHLSRADTAHFERLYTHVVGPERNLQRYVEENTWRRAQLGYDGQVYDIRVKSHGRNPTNHSEMQAGWRYRFISLSIKLEAGHRIHGLNRFKLIVRRGFSDAAPIVSMAKHVGVFVQDHRLVRVQINNWPEHLFYFSNVLDDRYLESSGFGPFRRIFYDEPESAYSDHDDLHRFSISAVPAVRSGSVPRSFRARPRAEGDTGARMGAAVPALCGIQCGHQRSCRNGNGSVGIPGPGVHATPRDRAPCPGSARSRLRVRQPARADQYRERQVLSGVQP